MERPFAETSFVELAGEALVATAGKERPSFLTLRRMRFDMSWLLPARFGTIVAEVGAPALKISCLKSPTMIYRAPLASASAAVLAKLDLDNCRSDVVRVKNATTKPVINTMKARTITKAAPASVSL
jgi:hypothetical protein